MIHHDLYFKRKDWTVHCFFAVTADNAAEILPLLFDIGISLEQYSRAKKHLLSSVKNAGMTYSNLDKRESVFIIGKASSPSEILNTFSHELRHLVDDIAIASNTPLSGEDVGYMTGDLALAMASKLLYLACECPICSHEE